MCCAAERLPWTETTRTDDHTDVPSADVRAAPGHTSDAKVNGEDIQPQSTGATFLFFALSVVPWLVTWSLVAFTTQRNVPPAAQMNL